MNKQILTTTLSLSLFSLFVGCEPAEDQPAQVAAAPDSVSVEAPKENAVPTVAVKEPKKAKEESKNAPELKRIDGAISTELKPENLKPVDPSKIKKDPKAPPIDPSNLLPQAIEASPAILELGTFSTSEKGTGVVTLTNTADAAITILSARASCGCTTSDFQKNTVLNPGDTTDITITMDGKGKARKLSKTVTFTIDGRPPLRYEVKGESLSFVNLDVDPLVIDEETGSSTVTLTSTDGESFKVLSILPAIVANFSEEPAATQEIIIDWDSFWDEVRTTKVTIRLDHPKCKEITTNVRLSAEQRKRLNDIIKARRAGDDLLTKDPSRPLTGDQLARYVKAGQGKQVLKYIEDGLGKFDSVDRGGISLLSTAAKEGDAATVSGLLALGASLERVDRVNRTPLMHGVQSKNSEVITILLDAGADIQSRDSLGNTPLSWASFRGISDSVRILVDAGADVNAVDNVLGYTPLLWASGFGEPESIHVLLSSGADLEVHDISEGRTPLMHAVRTGENESVAMLVTAGADVNALDNTSQTALHVAAAGNNVDIEKVKSLVEGGANTGAKNKEGKTPLDLAKNRTDSNAQAVVDYLSEHSKSE